MRPLSVFARIAAGMLICLGALGAALAQGEPQSDQTQMMEQLGDDSDAVSDPPGRVAQLSYAEGSVSLEPAGTSSWANAGLNRPLTLGDKLWSDQDSRAELDIGDAVIRLGSTTGFSFLNLDEQTAQMQVTAGTVIVHVWSLSSGEQDEIDTPNLALTLRQPGIYRVEVSDSGDATVVKVDEGEALVTGGGQSYPVAAQQSVTFTGTSALAADYASLGAPDPLDEWSLQRDRQERQQAAVAQEYVPPDTVGTDDMGSDGTWESTPDWGYAWFPAVAPGWVPYSVGYWVWVSPWGWTWIDEEPWGFAPFHYGRWGYWGHRWCWIPGPRGVRPMYAPALVAWVGGPRAGASMSMAARIGWLPLGPRDVYVPGYRVSPNYVRNVNVANTRILNTAFIDSVYQGRVTNIRYANGEVPGAVTAVPRNVFTSAQPVGAHRISVPSQNVASLRPTTAAPAVVPLRRSILGAAKLHTAPPRALVDRAVVARLAPPRAPVSFSREQAAIRANGGRPLSMTELSRMRPYTPAAPVRLASPGTPARERVLQQSSLRPARGVRSDRPSWAEGQPVRPGAQRAPVERFVSPQRQAAPEQRSDAQVRQAPEQHYDPPVRQVPEQHFTSPGFNAPRVQARPSAPRAAPARAPEAHPAGRPPP